MHTWCSMPPLMQGTTFGSFIYYFLFWRLTPIFIFWIPWDTSLSMYVFLNHIDPTWYFVRNVLIFEESWALWDTPWACLCSLFALNTTTCFSSTSKFIRYVYIYWDSWTLLREKLPTHETYLDNRQQLLGLTLHSTRGIAHTSSL